MPVYNEAETVAQVIDDVLALELSRARLELIVVESNSRDGSREVVRRYESDPRVIIVLQEAALGKGSAVRAGLRHAQGDIILIQDADLEYTVDDYAALIEPIATGEADFVLGCRHVPGRPMRVMREARLIGWVVNSAHWVFTEIFNVMYWARLRDPFTMYKVFRSECIDGVDFAANRFDFDWELVGKLIRLGYQPLEVPIQYEARQFHEGKKVRFFRDPPTWLVACVRFRFAHLPRREHRQRWADQRANHSSQLASDAK